MTFDHIRNAVAQKARAEAESIEAEARKDAEQRIEAAGRSIEAQFERRLEAESQAAEQEAQRGVIQRRSEHNLSLLRKRNAMLDDVLAQAARRMTGLPDKEYCAVIGRWMEERIPATAGGVVLCGERDLERLRPVVDALNAGRAADARLEMALHEKPPTAGVVFRASQFEVDLSVDAMTARLRETLAPELSRILFPGEMTV
jgi:vacuolar-type H+-ATPase subunit E/Vma4